MGKHNSIDIKLYMCECVLWILLPPKKKLKKVENFPFNSIILYSRIEGQIPETLVNL